MKTRQSQSGIALLTVLFIVAIAVIASSAIAVNMHLAVSRASNFSSLDQAWWYAVGVEQWAGEILYRDREDNETDHPYEFWAKPVDYLPVENGFVFGQLSDLQGKINLNTLNGPNANDTQLYLTRLINNLGPDVTADGASIAAALRDWVDVDQNPIFPGGAEDGVYSSKTPPYRTADRLFTSLTELRLIEGMTSKLYEALLPHVSVLPPIESKVNLNTASAQVLQSMIDKLPPADAESLVAQIEQAAFENVTSFVQAPQLAGLQVNPDAFTVSSEYFQLNSGATIGETQVQLQSLLLRGNGGVVTVIAHGRRL